MKPTHHDSIASQRASALARLILLALAAALLLGGCAGTSASITTPTAAGPVTLATDGKTVTSTIDTPLGRLERNWPLPRK